MNRSRIDWCDMTWNPVTGCFHNCEYCYARRIALRFMGGVCDDFRTIGNGAEAIFELLGEKSSHPYPFGFSPTLHRYRLNEPQKVKKPQNIFVCSMADLFADYIPDEWIAEVFKACAETPQHRYLFLTKNPKRYTELQLPMRKNMWYGTTATTDDAPLFFSTKHHTFLSIEPILKPFETGEGLNRKTNWVIVGAESGSRKGKVTPEKRWIGDIAKQCREANVPLFMKESLRGIMGDEFIQQYPW